jgi:electron transfer flavoprotein beta subunit
MPLHIIVCIKSILKAAPQGSAGRTPDNSDLNPFDRPALEAALQVSAAAGGTVTALSMGPEVGTEALAEARAMGVDRAVLITDPRLAGSDTLVTSRVLGAAVRRLEPFDFLFFGTRSADSDTGQVGPQTAGMLAIPFLGRVKKMERRNGVWEFERTIDGWQENWQVQPPAAATIDPQAFPPRPVGLVGIARVYDPPDLLRWDAADLGLAAEAVGLAGSPTRVAALQKLRTDRKSEMLTGSPHEQVAELIERLTVSGKFGL